MCRSSVNKRVVLLGHVRRCFPVGATGARVKSRLYALGCTERMKNEPHPSVSPGFDGAERGRDRKVVPCYTKWGNRSPRKQPRYVSGDLALSSKPGLDIANSADCSLSQPASQAVRQPGSKAAGVNVQPSSSPSARLAEQVNSPALIPPRLRRVRLTFGLRHD